MTDTDPPPVQVALSQVMADVRAVGKDRKMDPKAGGYAYRSVDDVYDVLHGPLSRHGVIVLPDVTDLQAQTVTTGERTERHVAATLQVRVIGPAGDEVTFTAHGEGMDRRDRATQKAVTDAFKYALLRALCIPVTDNDTDEGEAAALDDSPAAQTAKRSTPPADRRSQRRPSPQQESTPPGDTLDIGELTPGQHKQLGEWGVDDDLRHDLAHIVSNGRTRSSAELTAPERAQLMRKANGLHTNRLKLEYKGDGSPELVSP